MNTLNWGRFTAKGSLDIEHEINYLLETIRQQLQAHLSPQDYIALLLTGGYGRGEGGVHYINGVPRLHNNLDFILLTQTSNVKKQLLLKEKIENLLAPLKAKHHIDIDLFLISLSKLRKLPNLVIIYDMYYGHKTILGDANWHQTLVPPQVDHIEAWDMRNLLINRGTLLLINDCILNSNKISKDDNKVLIKHLVKAIIGYGDALLFSKGQYHWSYLEKQKRMSVLSDISNEFKQLYEQAMNFRFLPNYDNFNLERFNSKLKSILSQIHLSFEAWRLNNVHLDWTSYPQEVLKFNFKRPKSLKENLKQVSAFLSKGSVYSNFGLLENVSLKSSTNHELLAFYFPYLFYDLKCPNYKDFVTFQLQGNGSDRFQLILKYLYQWSITCDPSLLKRLQSYSMNPYRKEKCA